ncbi:hypothetical protein UB31_11720 [Bradyrhizobium sp. LTSP849]|uniref:hypothetical protein n=1 Tax=Bradyrhizobium sp. LTSP849 TaxID=1615890 RepID=UPI0005D192C3|nr:hypothetical protein [Bradyrhizobium sp. LTSP849]KJC50896.1 hypothetical protein UB31_11720 [Bradyrhizobium sp. LTSP849]
MASEKQIKANRENAKRSTGPKSLAGRLKSSRNAKSHGLSIPLAADPPTVTQAYKLVEVMTPEGASPSQKVAAVEMAQAQTQLLRVAAVRRALLAELDLESPSLEQVRRLVAIERYECRAHRRRRRAIGRLRGTEAMDDGVEGASAILVKRTQFDRTCETIG